MTGWASKGAVRKVCTCDESQWGPTDPWCPKHGIAPTRAVCTCDESQWGPVDPWCPKHGIRNAAGKPGGLT